MHPSFRCIKSIMEMRHKNKCWIQFNFDTLAPPPFFTPMISLKSFLCNNELTQLVSAASRFSVCVCAFVFYGRNGSFCKVFHAFVSMFFHALDTFALDTWTHARSKFNALRFIFIIIIIMVAKVRKFTLHKCSLKWINLLWCLCISLANL